jgi:hypothetical protein
MKRYIKFSFLLVLAAGVFPNSAVQADTKATLVNTLTIPGDAKDLSGLTPSGVNTDRLGFISDLYYDRNTNTYYGLSDRGPGGGVIPYNTRVEEFTLNVDSNSGAISNFNLIKTVQFTNNGTNYNGLNPTLLNGNQSVLGLSHDPEGFAISPNGNFYVSDEYGPSVDEFDPNGKFIRAFTTPSNLVPKLADGTINYTDSTGVVTGRQDNRGFEGLAMTPDGKYLYGMLQDPLTNEGNPNGTYSQNIRIVKFDTSTGQSVAQYLYQLDSLNQLNANLPPSDQFSAKSQGRNIGISSLIPINDDQLLVLERDNRGVGVDTPTTTAGLPTTSPQVAEKSVYEINVSGATDVTNINLNQTNSLPPGVIPVSKTATPLIDLASLLTAANQIIPEKVEGVTIGPKLNDGSYAVIMGTDNDYSVTQNGTNTQFNVCSDLKGNASEVALNQACPSGQSLLPTFLYSIKVPGSDLGNYIPPTSVPEPLTTLGGLVGLGLCARLKLILKNNKK